MKKLSTCLAILFLNSAFADNVKFVNTMLKDKPITLNRLTTRASLVEISGKNYLHTIFDNQGRERVVETMGDEFDYRELANSFKDFSNQKNQLSLYKLLYSKLPKKYKRWRIIRTPRSLQNKDIKVIRKAISSLSKNYLKIGKYIENRGAPRLCSNSCKHHPDGIFQNVNYPMKSIDSCVKLQTRSDYIEGITGSSVPQIWNVFDTDFSIASAKLASILKIPMILSFPITPSFDKAKANGYVQYLGSHEDNRGGYAAFVVAVVENKDLPITAPKGPGGGYFVLKNSWGGCWKDGGYIYLPITWVKAYAKSLTVAYSI